MSGLLSAMSDSRIFSGRVLVDFLFAMSFGPERSLELALPVSSRIEISELGSEI